MILVVLGGARLLPPRIIFMSQIAPRDEFEHCRNVLTFKSWLGVSPINEIRTGTGQMLRVGVAKEMIIMLGPGFGVSYPAVGLGLKHFDPVGTCRPLFGRGKAAHLSRFFLFYHLSDSLSVVCFTKEL